MYVKESQAHACQCNFHVAAVFRLTRMQRLDTICKCGKPVQRKLQPETDTQMLCSPSFDFAAFFGAGAGWAATAGDCDRRGSNACGAGGWARTGAGEPDRSLAFGRMPEAAATQTHN